MATIQQSIAITDGVTPQFQRMAKAAEDTTGKFERAAKSANKIEDAVSKTSITQVQNLDSAVRSTAGGFDNASSSANNLGNNIGNISSGFNRVREVMNSTLGKITLFSIVIAALTQIIGLIERATTKLFDLSDEYSGIVARIKLITSSAEQAVALNDQIYYSALRARGSYSGMADAVSKLGLTAKEAFPDPKTIVPFIENIQKLFTIGGTDAVRQKDAMLQLTQALGSGKLQGDEFRSIAEAAPMIEQMVARYMGVTQGQLKQLSTEGKITADIIKNAILGATNEINEKFASMPMTWEQVWQNMQTVAFRAFVPVFNQLSAIANSPAIKSFGESAGQSLIAAGLALEWVINNARWLGGIFLENSSIITPIIVGLSLVLMGLAINTGIATTAAIAHGVASMYETAAIIALIAAQDGLNAALYACPLTWIVFGVIAIVGVFYLAVAAINHFAGTSISATGIIVGTFFWLGGMIYNVIAFASNILVSFAESLGNLFRNPTAATYNLFATIWNGIVELVGRSINEIIGLINKLPGMEIGFVNWGKGLAKKMTIQGGIDFSSYSMDYSSGNFIKGYDIGAKGIGGLLPQMPVTPSQKSGLLPQMPVTPSQNSGLGDISQHTQDTANNTGKIKDAMEITDEDIKYLRDIAEQEVINKYTTAEVKIEMGGIHNNVSNDTDLDGMVRYMNDSLFDAMTAGAEKVHP